MVTYFMTFDTIKPPSVYERIINVYLIPGKYAQKPASVAFLIYTFISYFVWDAWLKVATSSLVWQIR